MVCAPVRRNNHRALARGLSTVQAHKPCSISLELNIQCGPCTLRISRAKDWVSVNYGTIIVKFKDLSGSPVDR